MQRPYFQIRSHEYLGNTIELSSAVMSKHARIKMPDSEMPAQLIPLLHMPGITSTNHRCPLQTLYP